MYHKCHFQILSCDEIGSDYPDEINMGLVMLMIPVIKYPCSIYTFIRETPLVATLNVLNTTNSECTSKLTDTIVLPRVARTYIYIH